MKTIDQKDVYNFCQMTGDMNPIHIDRDYAEKTKWGQLIAPGMYVASLIPAELVKKYGDGIIYVAQNIEFKAPVYMDDEVEVILTEVKKSGKLVTIETVCKVADKVVIEGIAKILLENLVGV